MKTFAISLLFALSLLASRASGAEEPDKEEPGFVGFDLGGYVLKDYQPLQDVTTRLIFAAHASVHEEIADEFARRLESRKRRVRDQVLTAARLAQPEELQDPKLELLRRRILLRLKHALPELPINEIYLSEFQLYTE